VLAVIDDFAGAGMLVGRGASAEVGAALEEGDAEAGIGEGAGGCEAGEATAGDGYGGLGGGLGHAGFGFSAVGKENTGETGRSAVLTNKY